MMMTENLTESEKELIREFGYEVTSYDGVELELSIRGIEHSRVTGLHVELLMNYFALLQESIDTEDSRDFTLGVQEECEQVKKLIRDARLKAEAEQGMKS